MVLVIDLDGRQGGEDRRDRLSEVLDSIPADLQDRVFVIGSAHDPETLRASTRQSLETMGSLLAQECRDENFEQECLWQHPQLAHNQREVERIHAFVRQYILPS